MSKPRKGKTATPPRAATPLPMYQPTAWKVDVAGRVEPVRRAEFWTARSGNRVSCVLCYRNCNLADGEAGWCKIRRNDRDVLQIPEHGVIAGFYPVYAQYFWWRKHARIANFGGVSCTAACSFCTSTTQTLNPDKLPWAQGERMASGNPYRPWAYTRAMLHPWPKRLCAGHNCAPVG